MVKKTIFPEHSAGLGLPLSPAVAYKDLIFLSGQTGYHGNRELAVGDFDAQMHQVMKNIISVLEAAHSSLDKVLKMNIYISKPEFFPKMNEIYKSYFSHQNFPARTTLVVDFAEPELLVEIECVAIK